MYKKLEKLNRPMKEFLLKHVADNEVTVAQFWNSPMSVIFDKQRLAHIYIMIAPLDGQLNWIMHLRLTKKSGGLVKPTYLWRQRDFDLAEKMMGDFYSDVGVEIEGFPHFEKLENGYMYAKLLTDDELKLLLKSAEIFDETDSALDSSVKQKIEEN